MYYEHLVSLYFFNETRGVVSPPQKKRGKKLMHYKRSFPSAHVLRHLYSLVAGWACREDLGTLHSSPCHGRDNINRYTASNCHKWGQSSAPLQLWSVPELLLIVIYVSSLFLHEGGWSCKALLWWLCSSDNQWLPSDFCQRSSSDGFCSDIELPVLKLKRH